MLSGGKSCIISYMQIDFLTSLINVGLMAALCVPGFILRKRKMLPETAVAALVAVLIYVSQPVLTVSGFMEKDYDPSLLPNMAIVLLGSFVVHFAAYLVARLVFKVMPAGDEEKDRANRVGTICSFMGNVGFMGIPVVKALFPNNPEMLIYVAIINVSFNVVSWTLGVYTITGDKSNVSIRRAFLNPPTVALVAALPLFFFKAYIPTAVFAPVQSCANYLAGMTLPLSMIILGIRLAEIPFKSLFTSPVAYVSTALKLVVVPLVSFAILYPIHAFFPQTDNGVIISIFIAMAMPSAALTLSFAEMFDGDRETAVKTSVITTALSVLTIPLLMLLCGLL